MGLHQPIWLSYYRHLHSDVCLTALAPTPEPPQEDLNLCRTCVGSYTMQQGNLHAASSLEATTLLLEVTC